MENNLTHGINLYPYSVSDSIINLKESSNINPTPSFSKTGSDLTIIILSFNRVNLTIRLLNSIFEYIPNYEGKILITDNGSNEEQIKELEKGLKKFPEGIINLVKYNKNHGVAGGRNRAVPLIETKWFLSLDNDIYLVDNPLSSIKECIDKLGVQFLNVPLLKPDHQTIDALGGNLWMEKYEDTFFISGTSTFKQINKNEIDLKTPFLCNFLYGGASIMLKEAFLNEGGYESNMFIGFEDTELSLRLFKKSIKIGNTTDFCFVHDHQEPKTSTDKEAEKARFSTLKIRESGEYFKRKHGLVVWTPGVDTWIKERLNDLKIESDEPILAIAPENKIGNVYKNTTLNNEDLNIYINEIRSLKEKFEEKEYELKALKSSKFFKIRDWWFGIRKLIGLNTSDSILSIKSLEVERANKIEIEPYNYKNILHSIPQNPNGKTVLLFIPFMVVGGAETAILQVLKGYKKRKYNVSLIVTAHATKESGNTIDKFLEVCPDLYILENYNTLWGDNDNWKHWRNLTFTVLEERKINNIIISNSSFSYLLLDEIKQTYPNIKVINPIYSVVGHMEDNVKHANKIDLTIVENPLVENYLIENCLREKERIQLIENGVDTSYFNPNLSSLQKRNLKKKFFIAKDKFVISFIGRLSHEKGPDLFMQYTELLNSRSDIHFLVAGGGPMFDDIIRQNGFLKTKNTISVIGYQDTKEILSISDIMILPSRIDGRPNVVLESLSMGVPVIASEVGGLPWIINENIGELANPNNLQSFADSTNKLLKNIEFYKSNARKYAIEKLNVENTRKAYDKICQ